MEVAELLSCIFPSLSNKKLPPGPPQWPLIGQLHQISLQRPHADMADLARVHGPFLSLRLGTELVVVALSPAAAREVLKTHDRNLASRFVPHTCRVEDYAPYSWLLQQNVMRGGSHSDLYAGRSPSVRRLWICIPR